MYQHCLLSTFFPFTQVRIQNVDPYYGETLYFRIRSFKPDMPTAAELRKFPFIEIAGFDHDEAGVSQPLGTTKLFIHEITQVPTPTKMTLQLKSSSSAQFLPNEVYTRVLRKTLPLSGLPTGCTSSVKVESFFLAPITSGRDETLNLKWNDIGGRRRGDLYEPNAEKRKTDGLFLVLKEYKEDEIARANAKCFCYHPLLTVGEHRESVIEQGGSPPALSDEIDANMRMVCEGSFAEAKSRSGGGGGGGGSNSNMCHQLKQSHLLIENNFQDDERFVSFRVGTMSGTDGGVASFTGLLHGLNFNRERRFLPTFLCPIPPPRALFDKADTVAPEEKWEREGSAGHSELEGLSCVDSQKPNTSYKLACMVRAMEFCKHEEQLIWGDDVGGRDAWLEPPQFMEMRAADTKSHVLLLASLLLGIKIDAYVCIGTVADVDPQTGELNGAEPKMHVWLMTRESDSTNCRAPYWNSSDPLPDCDPDGFDKPINMFGSIKFWELSSPGRLDIDPLPNRWNGRDDEKAYEDSKRVEKKPKFKREKEEVRKVDEAAPASESDSSSDDENEGPPKEEDMLNNPSYLSAEKNVDSKTNVSSLFNNTAGLDGHWGRPDQQEMMTKRKEEFDHRHQKMSMQANAKAKASADAAAASLEATYVARSEWIQQDHHTRKWTTDQDQLPHVSLVAVFNHKNVWLNIQDTNNPFLMSYDFELGSRAGWHPVINQGYGVTKKGTPRTWRGNTVFPFYETPVLSPPVSSEQAQKLEESISMSVMAYLTNARDASNLPTKWAAKEIGPVLAELLAAEQELRRLPKILKNGWDKEKDSSIT